MKKTIITVVVALIATVIMIFVTVHAWEHYFTEAETKAQQEWCNRTTYHRQYNGFYHNRKENSKMKYYYGMKYRGFSIGAQPKKGLRGMG